MESTHYKNRILPRNIRWLAVVTGCITGIALLSFVWLSLSGIILIVGAVMQPRLPRMGRWLLSVGAPLLSVWVIPFGSVCWVEILKGLNHLPFELIPVSLLFAWMISPILLIWLNAALVIEAVKERRTRTEPIPPHTARL